MIKKIRTNLLTEDVEKIIQLYNSGIGTEQIAKQLSVHSSTIQKQLKKANILIPKQKYSINNVFFGEYESVPAYWAGFLMADGYVREKRHMFGLHLQEQDKHHLENLLECLSSNHKLLYDKNSKAWCVQIYNKNLKEDLQNFYNILPTKSKIATFPTQLPVKCYKDFIRGVIDGDGCICMTTCPTLSLVGSTSLLVPINEIFSSITTNNHISTVCHPNKTKNWFSSISYYSTNAKEILDWLYLDSTSHTRLKRKYEKYQKLFYNKE